MRATSLCWECYSFFSGPLLGNENIGSSSLIFGLGFPSAPGVALSYISIPIPVATQPVMNTRAANSIWLRVGGILNKSFEAFNLRERFSIRESVVFFYQASELPLMILLYLFRVNELTQLHENPIFFYILKNGQSADGADKVIVSFSSDLQALNCNLTVMNYRYFQAKFLCWYLANLISLLSLFKSWILSYLGLLF